MLEADRLPNIIGLFFGKDDIMEAGLIQNRLGQVDALIEPDVTLFGGFDFPYAEELIEIGRRAVAPILPSPRPPPPYHPYVTYVAAPLQ